MKNKIFFITIIIFLFVMLIGFFLFFNFKNKLSADLPPTLSKDFKSEPSGFSNSLIANSDKLISDSVNENELLGSWIIYLEEINNINSTNPSDLSITLNQDKTYRLNTAMFNESGIFVVLKNQIIFSPLDTKTNLTLDEYKIFANIKNNQLILIYPEYPKVSIYNRKN